MCVNVKDSFDVVMVNTNLLIPLKSTNNDRHILHAWLDKDYKSSGMTFQ